MPFIFGMKYAKLFVGSLAAGIAFILAGFYIRALDVGSCPLDTSPTRVGYITTCYHTFPNTNVFISPTGTLVIGVGVALLIAALVIGLSGRFSSRKNVPTKLEPQPAQVNT